MSVFESLLALLFVAILLLQVARRLSLPYPAMLAGAGVLIALMPGAPRFKLDPHLSLALFVAPVLLDAAFDFPFGVVQRMWRPLFALAVVAVLLTAGAVAGLGVVAAGLPLYAAVALGAIVAPPDAAAATAVLGAVSLPRRVVAAIKGESLLNDATALLLFSAAIQVQQHGGVDPGVAFRLGLAAPGGVLLGLLLAWLYRRVSRFVSGTLGGNLLDFVMTFTTWVLAERLGLSAVLCLVAFAMSIARASGLRQPPRVRVHTFALWDSVVFALNVLAFLLMGLQARTIVEAMAPERLREAAGFAALVVTCVVLVRLAWVLAYNRLSIRFPGLRGRHIAPVGLRQGVLIAWCGTRGLVTLATAFALPPNFPQRDLVVFTAFAVVVATLVVQGLTLAPLARWLRLDSHDAQDKELADARASLREAGLAALSQTQGPEADNLRYDIAMSAGGSDPSEVSARERHHALSTAAIRSQRLRLEDLRRRQVIGPDAYLVLQEELDFRELALADEKERRIEEG